MSWVIDLLLTLPTEEFIMTGGGNGFGGISICSILFPWHSEETASPA